MNKPELLLQLAATLKALHSERQLQDDLTPHTNVMKMRCAAKGIACQIKATVDEVMKDILSGREKEVE